LKKEPKNFCAAESATEVQKVLLLFSKRSASLLSQGIAEFDYA
jgi:hypothetical protein